MGSRRGCRQEKEAGTRFVKSFQMCLHRVLFQGVIVALPGRAPAILAKGAPQNNRAAIALPSARAACGHKHVST